MSKPTIVAVDDDPMVLQAIGRDLRERYGADYRVIRAGSGAEALTALAELALRDRPVALIVTDQRMPGMSGIEMLSAARTHAPENTIEAFALARRLGATGLESDVWMTADGVAVLDHDGIAGRGLRRRPIADVAAADLPEHIPTSSSPST